MTARSLQRLGGARVTPVVIITGSAPAVSFTAGHLLICPPPCVLYCLFSSPYLCVVLRILFPQRDGLLPRTLQQRRRHLSRGRGARLHHHDEGAACSRHDAGEHSPGLKGGGGRQGRLHHPDEGRGVESTTQSSSRTAREPLEATTFLLDPSYLRQTLSPFTRPPTPPPPHTHYTPVLRPMSCTAPHTAAGRARRDPPPLGSCFPCPSSSGDGGRRRGGVQKL